MKMTISNKDMQCNAACVCIQFIWYIASAHFVQLVKE